MVLKELKVDLQMHLGFALAEPLKTTSLEHKGFSTQRKRLVWIITEVLFRL